MSASSSGIFNYYTNDQFHQVADNEDVMDFCEEILATGTEGQESSVLSLLSGASFM